MGAPENEIDSHEDHHDDPDSWIRCRVCARPILPDPQRPGRTVHARCEPHLAHQGRHSA